MATKYLFVLAMLALASGVLFAGCAEDAYAKSCSSCSFDAFGKMDSMCSGGYKASGTACVSTTYPIASAKYAAGECPGIDSCTSELSSCESQMRGATDKETCTEGSARTCYAAADICVRQAAVKCGEMQDKPACGAPAAILLGVLGCACFLARR